MAGGAFFFSGKKRSKKCLGGYCPNLDFRVVSPPRALSRSANRLVSMGAYSGQRCDTAGKSYGSPRRRGSCGSFKIGSLE